MKAINNKAINNKSNDLGMSKTAGKVTKMNESELNESELRIVETDMDMEEGIGYHNDGHWAEDRPVTFKLESTDEGMVPNEETIIKADEGATWGIYELQGRRWEVSQERKEDQDWRFKVD